MQLNTILFYCNSFFFPCEIWHLTILLGKPDSWTLLKATELCLDIIPNVISNLS